MTHTYNINIDNNIITEEFIGDVDLETLDKINSSIIEDKNFKKGLNFLTDLRNSNLLISYQEMLQHVKNLLVCPTV